MSAAGKGQIKTQVYYNQIMRWLLLLIFLFWQHFCVSLAVSATPAEKQLEAKLQQQLEAIVGPGKVHVTVSGRSPASGRQLRALSRTQPQLIHERSLTERHQGVVRQRSEKVWGFAERETLLTESTEGLTQKSISVIYEMPQQPEENESAHPAVDQALIEGIVRTIAQVDEARGDQLKIQTVRMDTSTFDRLKAAMEKARERLPFGTYVLWALGGLGLGIGIGLWFRRRRRSAATWEMQGTSWPSTSMPVPNSVESRN